MARLATKETDTRMPTRRIGVPERYRRRQANRGLQWLRGSQSKPRTQANRGIAEHTNQGSLGSRPPIRKSLAPESRILGGAGGRQPRILPSARAVYRS